MAQLSKLFRDQKEHPLERAIWWIEWVLRNPTGSAVLQSNAVNISWIAKYSFDVIVPLLMLVAISVHVLVKIVSVVFCRSKPSKKSKRE